MTARVVRFSEIPHGAWFRFAEGSDMARRYYLSVFQKGDCGFYDDGIADCIELGEPPAPDETIVYSSVARVDNTEEFASIHGTRFAVDPNLLDDLPSGYPTRIKGRVAFSATSWPDAFSRTSCRSEDSKGILFDDFFEVNGFTDDSQMIDWLRGVK
jgi:hypothetical protein